MLSFPNLFHTQCLGETNQCVENMKRWLPFTSCERYIACHHFGNAASTKLRTMPRPGDEHHRCLYNVSFDVT